jgi:hypothetical protein
MISSRCGWTLVVLAALAGADAARAQMAAPAPAANPVCTRLEAQLAAIDRGTADPARADQTRRAQEASDRAQADFDRLSAQARRQGCEGGGFFSLFSGQNPQCGPLNQQIQQARANLEKLLADLDRLQSGGAGDREAQRATVIGALAQNNCGPQYAAAANQQRGFFDTLFGGNRSNSGPGGGLFSPDMPSGTYRTLCVRTCDGYYFPISYSTVPSKFADDEQLCRRMCPATEVTLYSHRNPGEDVAQAVSSSGRPYTALPTAFSYRKQYNPACSCRAPGQSWLDALRQGGDQTVERGDIVVTEERAKQLSQPRFDAQGKPVKPDPARPAPSDAASAAPAQAAAGAETAPAADDKPEDAPGKRKVRAVGPAFYPAR